MATTRKTSLNARQRARKALQEEMEKLKKREDLLVEVLTAADARDAAEVRLGEALNALRSLGMSQAEMAEGTGLASREISAAMRSANEADEPLDDEPDDEYESADEVENRALESDEEYDQPLNASVGNGVGEEADSATSDDVKSRLGHPVANG